jgi:hypothetical protein
VGATWPAAARVFPKERSWVRGWWSYGINIHSWILNSSKWMKGQTSFPGSSLLWRKDPGWSWSCGMRKFDRPRGNRQSMKLHASPSALYTSIARSESVLYNQLWESYKIQVLAKFGSCLLLNYKKHAKHIFIATAKSGSQAIKTYDHMLWNCSHVLSRPLAHFHFTCFFTYL